MSKVFVRICVCLPLLLVASTAFAQYLQPNSIQVSRVQYEGNAGNTYVSPYSFPELFNDQAGCTTGNEICDIAGIQGSIWIDQFNSVPQNSTTGTSLSLPSTGTPAGFPTTEPGSYITTSFSSKSEGALMLSPNGQYLTYMGYQGNPQLDDVSNGYSVNPTYDLVPNSYTLDPGLGTPVTITAASDSSKGVATITLSSPVTVPINAYFTIAGMNTTSYNGTWATSAASNNSTTITLTGLKDSLASCSSASTCGGTATYDPPYPLYDREVALINSSGLVNLTPIDNAFSGDNPRAAITVDGGEFYMGGNSDSTEYGSAPNITGPGLTIGARCGIPENAVSYQLGTYVAADRSDESAKKHIKDNNWRGIGIYTDGNGNQQLYVSKGSGSNGDDGVFLVQDPNTLILPTCTAGGTDTSANITEVFGAQATVPNGASYQTSPYLPFGFWFANPTTLYVADEGNPPSYTGGSSPSFENSTNGTFTLPQLANGSFASDPYAGLEKWSLVGGTWTYDYTIQTGLNLYQPVGVNGYSDINGDSLQSYTYGIRNMTGYNNGDGTVTIYAITSQFSAASGGEPDPDSLVGITDTLAATTLPANEQFTTLQTSAPGEVFRGVAYIPPQQGFTRQSQTINFASVGSVTYGQGPVALSATATSGWPIYFAVTSGPATVSGSTLTINGAGQVTVTATQTGNTDYASATTSQTFTVAQQTPGITWATPAPITYGTPLSSAQLNATANVPGVFSYSPSAGTVVSGGSQTLSVTFTPTDSTDYSTAMGSVTLQVNQATPTVSWAAPAPITYGTALSSTQLNATASVAGTFTYTPPAGTVLNAGSQPLSLLFTPSDSTDYTTANGSTSITVNQASQTITFTTPPPSSAGYQSSFTVVATASSGLPVLYVAAGVCTDSYTPTYIMNSASGTCTVIAAQQGNSNYLAAPELSATVKAIKGTPVVAWPTPAAITYGTALGSGQLDATAVNGIGGAVAGSFKYTPPAGKVLTVGTQNLSVTFLPTLKTDYNNASASVSLEVLAASTTTAITSSDQTVTQNKSGLATATLDYNVASYKPTGAVTVTASTGETCTGTVVSATGNGSCKLYFTTPGTRTVTAAYSGDDNHTPSNSGSQSPAVTVTVNP